MLHLLPPLPKASSIPQRCKNSRRHVHCGSNTHTHTLCVRRRQRLFTEQNISLCSPPHEFRSSLQPPGGAVFSFLFFFFLSLKLIFNGSECVCSFCRDPVQPHTYKNSVRLRGILASALASANPGRQRCRRAFVWEVKGGKKEAWKQRGMASRRSGAPRSGTLHSANAKSSIFVCGCHSNAQPKPIKNAKRGRIFEKVFFFRF